MSSEISGCNITLTLPNMTQINKFMAPFHPVEIIPKKSYIDTYVEWASKISIAPKEYHIATALSHLSALCDRNVYMPFTWKKIYTNLWIIVLGQTRISKKTTATEDIGKEKVFNFVDRDYLLPSDITPQKLFSILAERSQKYDGGKGMMYTDEIGGFLAKLGRAEYMEGGKDFLCNLYNCPDSITKATKYDGILEIENAYLTILGNTTEERLSKVIKEDDFLSGFIIRFLLFNAPIPVNDYKTTYETFETEKDRIAIVNHLKKVKELVGSNLIHFKLSDEADKEYVKFQKYVDSKILNENKYWMAELPNQLIKISMLLEISNIVNNVYTVNNVNVVNIVNKDTILQAKDILHNCSSTLDKCIDSIDTLTTSALTEKVLTILDTSLTTKPRDIQRKIYRSKITEIKEALNKLVLLELAKKTEKGYLKV